MQNFALLEKPKENFCRKTRRNFLVEKTKENCGRKTKRKFLVEKLKEITDTPPLFFPKFRSELSF